MDLDQEFHADELLELLNKGELQSMARKGYVAQADMNGMCRWVHWSKAATRDVRGQSRLKNRTYEIDKTFADMAENLTPINKRTPEERVDALVYRLIEDTRKYGSVPGLSDETITEIVGEFWKTGQTEVTAAMVRRIAQHFMEQAEREALSN